MCGEGYFIASWSKVKVDRLEVPPGARTSLDLQTGPQPGHQHTGLLLLLLLLPPASSCGTPPHGNLFQQGLSLLANIRELCAFHGELVGFVQHVLLEV